MKPGAAGRRAGTTTVRRVAAQAVGREAEARMVGREVDVLVDAASRRRDTELSGRTSTNVVVNLPGPPAWIGNTVRVRIERAGPHSVWGRATADDAAGDGVEG